MPVVDPAAPLRWSFSTENDRNPTARLVVGAYVLVVGPTIGGRFYWLIRTLTDGVSFANGYKDYAADAARAGAEALHEMLTRHAGHITPATAAEGSAFDNTLTRKAD